MRPDRAIAVSLLIAGCRAQPAYLDVSGEPCSTPDYAYIDDEDAPADEVGTGGVRLTLGPTSMGDAPSFTFEEPWVELEFDGWYGSRWKVEAAPADCPDFPVNADVWTRAGAGWLTTPAGVDAAVWTGGYRPSDGESGFGAYITAPPFPERWRTEIGAQYAATHRNVHGPVDIEVRAMGVSPGGYGYPGWYRLILEASWRIPGEAVDSRSAFNVEGEVFVEESW